MCDYEKYVDMIIDDVVDKFDTNCTLSAITITEELDNYIECLEEELSI